MTRRFKTQFDKRPVRDGVFPCDVLREGDGIDPRYERSPRRIDNRKALQLCAQVFDILNLTFGQFRDEKLQNLYCESVTPAPDSSHLSVKVIARHDPDEVRESLIRANGLIRTEIAAGINRKRTPNLKYEVTNQKEKEML